MKLIGEEIFTKDAEGRLKSRIGTMFFKTPGLVTEKGVHALQRVRWLQELALECELTPQEEEAELEESVDLIFTETEVLIRPNPARMDLAFRADAELQKTISKRKIRFLNTNSAAVREALRERGENWRMARQPISQKDMADLIASTLTALDGEKIYYYNPMSGTRFITPGGYATIEKLGAAEFRRQLEEIVAGLNKRNRHGYPEIDLFPPMTPIEFKRALKEMKTEKLSDEELRRKCDHIALEWRMSIPPELRDESVANYEWRNEMCAVLTRSANETAADEQELIAGISPEFYRQIEWLPGARIVDGEVLFDEIYEEAERTQAPELLALCDNRVKSFLFNTTRLFGRVKYINIGRIAASLSRQHEGDRRRGHVYIMQYLEEGYEQPKVFMIRLQKWGVAEHLDEGKDLLQAISEADEYSDYILDRRLMCRQLGMNLPLRVGFGHFTETYRGENRYNGAAVRSAYFVRHYVRGTASDKLPLAKYRNPAWAQKFAFLMGAAAALDLIVGRRDSSTGEVLFDQAYEVVQPGEDGMPGEIRITDHTGSFTDYLSPLEDLVEPYAQFALRRRKYVTEFENFALAYVEGFRRKLAETRENYLKRRGAFDRLFIDRPYDTNGSGAYRWECALKRLESADAEALAARLKAAIGC